MWMGGFGPVGSPVTAPVLAAVTIYHPHGWLTCQTSWVPLRMSHLAIWLMVGSTLVFLPGGMIRFVFPKLLFVAAAILLGALAARRGRLPRSILLVAGAGALAFLLSAATSGTPVPSILGRWPRYEGLPVLALYAGSAWLGARLVAGDERDRRGRELLRATAAMSVALGVASSLEAIGWSVIGESDLTRTGSLLGNATDQGLVAMMAVALLVGPAIRTPSPTWLIGLGFALLTVALSGSRAAILATIVALGVHLLAGRSAAVRPVVAGIVALVTVALLVPQARDRLTNTDTVTGRSVLWSSTADLMKDNLLLGVGPSRFVDAIGEHEGSSWVDRAGIDLAPDSPHSWPLQAMTAGGLPLLLLALALAASVMVLGWRAVRERRDVLTVGLFAASFGYGLALLANFTIAGSTCFAAFLVGALVGERASPSSRARREGAAVAGLAGLAVVGTLMASVAEIDLQKGVTAAARGDVAASDAAFTRASRWRPLDSDVAMIASTALAGPVSIGRPEAIDPTRRWAQRSLDRTPDTYDSGLSLAITLIAEGDLAAAQERLDDLIARFPVTQAAYVQRGIARFGQRDVEGARSDLERARVLDPEDPAPRAILDEISRRLG